MAPGKVDQDRIRLADGLIVLDDLLAQFTGLDADGGIMLRVVGFRLAERIDSDTVLLQFIGLAANGALNKVGKQRAMLPRVPEGLTLQNSFQLLGDVRFPSNRRRSCLLTRGPTP